MSDKIKKAFRHEMNIAISHYRTGDYKNCFSHLERAHILGQRFYIPHVISHYWMLKIGIKRRDVKEIAGQVLRIVGSLGSVIGWVPVGNTGGANVSPFKPMPIPEDLKKILLK